MDPNWDTIPCQIKDLGSFRIDSFNYAIHTGIKKVTLDIEPMYARPNIKISVSDAVMKQLTYPMDLRRHKKTVYPAETRLRAATYLAELHVQLRFEKEQDVEYCTRIFYVPVMVKSDLCLLKDLKGKELVQLKEDVNDPGGYFIVKGKERIFRHFVVLKRNYPLALIQTKWKSYRKGYTEYGILVRCVKDECIFSTVSLHLLNDGHIELRLFYNFTPIFVQVMLILKALIDECDIGIINKILRYHKEFPVIKLKNMLQVLHKQGIHSHCDAKNFLGKQVFPVLNLPAETSYSDAANYLFEKSLLVHLSSYEKKFEFLCFSLCKLQCVGTDKIRADDLDNPVYQEVLSTGQTYLLVLKDGIVTYLKSVRYSIEKAAKTRAFHFHKDCLQKYCNYGTNPNSKVASMIATGNFQGTRFGLASDTGYTISFKRRNVFELAAQLNAICKFSMDFYPRNCRVYYPESWGFLCPTQTPEGENCGLYNQIASQCKIVNLNSKRIDEDVLFKFGVLPCNDPLINYSHPIYPVYLDGIIIGWINYSLIGNLLLKLLHLKSSNSSQVPYHSEIVFISKEQKFCTGIYLFSSSCRMVRKIFNEKRKKEEYIGMFEQVFLCDLTSVIPNELCYSEIEEANFLSLSARMIPFCENNETVRNIFSSVKCKQAIGLPFLNFNGRSDSKFFQLVYGQSPIVSTKIYSESNFDFYPFGTNVIVAIVSYSGFDMEDALVLNKASVERGLMQNMVYKTVFYDFTELAEECKCNSSSELELKRNEKDPAISKFLEEDGVPIIGTRVNYNDPILSVYNKREDLYVVKRYLERCTSYVHSVNLMGDVPCSTKNIPKNSKKLSITFCTKKVPEVGDKFSNRHGGKGICSALMRSEDLPFSTDGLIPDILFNPHGLPSRMSIGMLFEMAAAKASVQKGSKYPVEPFESKSCETYEEIGQALTEAGFSYYGTETFYSGTSGEELAADVFCGCMYYLRLHHVVEEKYQVRSTGPVDEKTYQPTNPGRSGAIRFGEMERDAILSHGAMNLTLDRLLINSDVCTAFVCRRCHLLIYPSLLDPEMKKQKLEEKKYCKLCEVESTFKIRIPYVLVYLVCELAVLGISVRLLDS